ncbi:MAG TPA: BatD family protein, partial [Polyangia bacterium]
MRSLTFLAAAGTLLFATTVFGQGTSFTARAGRNPVGVGEAFPFEVSLSLDNARMEDYRPPDFHGFRIVAQQPSQSTQIQMGGGGGFMRQTYSWHYQLVALQKGKLTIAPASVRVDGRELRTEKVAVTVVDSGQAQPAPQQRQLPRGVPGFPGANFFFPDLEPDTEPEPLPEAAKPAGRRNFLRVVPSKTKAFAGEQITVEWQMYLTERQNNYAPTKEPRTDGFWAEELEVPQNRGGLSLSEQVIEGRVYLFAPLMRKALFGLNPGKYTITPLEADISRVDFFGATVKSEHLKADPVTIEIVPLPAGAPAGFDPSAVGRFTLAAEVDRDHVQVGDAITLKLRLDGQGNLRKITLPAMPRLDGWKLYEPKVSVQMNRGNDIGGSKLAEYLLLPERPGQTTIHAFTFSYFDTQKAAYATVKTTPLSLVVTGEALVAQGAHAPTSVATPSTSGSENLLAIDVRPLRSRPSLRRDLGSALYHSPALLGVAIAPPLLFALVSLFGVARTHFGRETEGKRRRKLRRSADRRLRTATAHLREGRLAPSL